MGESAPMTWATWVSICMHGSRGGEVGWVSCRGDSMVAGVGVV